MQKQIIECRKNKKNLLGCLPTSAVLESSARLSIGLLNLDQRTVVQDDVQTAHGSLRWMEVSEDGPYYQVVMVVVVE